MHQLFNVINNRRLRNQSLQTSIPSTDTFRSFSLGKVIMPNLRRLIIISLVNMSVDRSSRTHSRSPLQHQDILCVLNIRSIKKLTLEKGTNIALHSNRKWKFILQQFLKRNRPLKNTIRVKGNSLQVVYRSDHRNTGTQDLIQMDRMIPQNLDTLLGKL